MSFLRCGSTAVGEKKNHYFGRMKRCLILSKTKYANSFRNTCPRIIVMLVGSCIHYCYVRKPEFELILLNMISVDGFNPVGIVKLDQFPRDGGLTNFK